MTWIKANKQWMGFVLALVAAMGLGGAGVGAAERFIFSKEDRQPQISTIDLTKAVQDAVTEAMKPYQQELTRTRLAAEEAKNLAQSADRSASSAKDLAASAQSLFTELNTGLREDMKAMARDMGSTKVDIATLLERTRPRLGPG